MSSRWMESGKRVQCLLFVLLLAPLSFLGTGCRFNDPSVDLLQGELRWMEDQLYEMENNLEQACVDLSRCKSDAQREIKLYEEKAQARSQPNSDDIAPVPQPEVEIPGYGYETIGGPNDAPSQIIMPDGSVVPDQPAYPIEPPTEPYALPSEFPIESSPVILEDDGTTVPTISDQLPAPVSTSNGNDNDDGQPTRAELPSPGDADVPDRPDPDSPEPGIRPSIERDQNGGGGDEQAIRLLPRESDMYSIRLQSHVTSEPIRTAASTNRNVDAHITHVVIKAHRTARRSDGSGHDLEILVQPRNADGTYVSLPANLSVVVIDDNQQGAAARIARWDLDATEASRRFRKTEHGEGMHLEFDWPLDPPNSDKLHMYVRYTTVDGRKLQTHQFLEPLSASKPKDEQWTVVGRTKPADGWKVMTIPIEENSSQSVAQPKPSRVIPASAKRSPVRSPCPSPTVRQNEWKTVPTSAPAEPRRMPNITAQPIPKPQTAAIGSGVVPASVPEWSPRR